MKTNKLKAVITKKNLLPGTSVYPTHLTCADVSQSTLNRWARLGWLEKFSTGYYKLTIAGYKAN